MLESAVQVWPWDIAISDRQSELTQSPFKHVQSRDRKFVSFHRSIDCIGKLRQTIRVNVKKFDRELVYTQPNVR